MSGHNIATINKRKKILKPVRARYDSANSRTASLPGDSPAHQSLKVRKVLLMRLARALLEDQVLGTADRRRD